MAIVQLILSKEDGELEQGKFVFSTAAANKSRY